ncbi:fungal-specific transcription factor domain-containing protein [Halenospora varia]|nr:fungal-specific transcription factor domain-containing protein [Halenospora varia]
MSAEPSRRKIKLETRHGGSRESRSRRDRPCDICRTRKSACVIAVKPPCRFCEIRGLECTFATGPRPRHREPKSSSETSEAVESEDIVDADKPASDVPKTEAQVGTPDSHVSPQASRFPVPCGYVPPSSAISASSPESERSAPSSRGRQYLSLQELTSNPAPATFQVSLPQQQPEPSLKRHAGLYSHESSRNRHSLEHGRNLTAHFIGLSGEQDTDLFSSIRYNVLNETKFVDFNVRQVYAGDPLSGEPPIHFSILHDTFPDRDQRVKKAASDAIEAHVQGYADALFRLYFRFVHPVMPVLSKAGTVMAYAADKLSIPASLRGIMYGLALPFWTQDPTLKDKPLIGQAELFEHAHTALNRELDSPKLSTLQACLLILHEQPDISGTTESPRIWVLACQATAVAQSLGLHQDPSLWKLPQWEKKLRKRLWWATYMNDVWTSICHGNAPHILPSSFSMAELSLEDLSSDENVVGLPGAHLIDVADQEFQPQAAASFLEGIELTKVLSDVLKNSYSPQSYREAIRQENKVGRQTYLLRYMASVEKISSAASQYKPNQPSSTIQIPSPLGTPSTLHDSGYFHLSVYAIKFLILRQLLAPATHESKSDPDSNLCRHYALAMKEGENFVELVSKMCATDLHAFWPRHSRTNLIIGGNHLIYLFFCSATEVGVAKSYELLQRYQELLSSAAKKADWSTVGLVRPSLLRTDSFFHNAAEGIRLSSRT